jgi:hypothetical protein
MPQARLPGLSALPLSRAAFEAAASWMRGTRRNGAVLHPCPPAVSGLRGAVNMGRSYLQAADRPAATTRGKKSAEFDRASRPCPVVAATAVGGQLGEASSRETAPEGRSAGRGTSRQSRRPCRTDRACPAGRPPDAGERLDGEDGRVGPFGTPLANGGLVAEHDQAALEAKKGGTVRRRRV